MKRFRLFIGTTDGPAEVQRVTPEDKEVRSVICLDGKAISLPISDDYDLFVRRPTGVVESLLGHPAYRVDVSRPIAGGFSWQLGILVAHILADGGRLATPKGRADGALWITGEVDHGLNVGTVGDVPLKLAKAADGFKALIEDQIALSVIVPEGNLEEAQETLTAGFPDCGRRPRLIDVKHLDDVLNAIGASRPNLKAAQRAPSSSPSKTLLRGLALATATTAAVMVAAADWKSGDGAAAPDAGVTAIKVSVPQQAATAPQPGTPDAAPHRLGVIEVRAPAGGDCAKVHFSNVQPRIHRHSVQASGSPAVTPVAPHGLCDLRYRVTHAGLGSLTIAAIAARHDRAGHGFRTKTLAERRLLTAGGTVDLDGRPPRRLAAALMQRVVLLAMADATATGDDAPLVEGTKALRAAASLGTWEQTVSRLRQQGLFVVSAQQAFLPTGPAPSKTGQTSP